MLIEVCTLKLIHTYTKKKENCEGSRLFSFLFKRIFFFSSFHVLIIPSLFEYKAPLASFRTWQADISEFSELRRTSPFILLKWFLIYEVKILLIWVLILQSSNPRHC